MMSMQLEALDTDLLLAILHHLNPVALCSLACVCRKLREVAETAELWTSLVQHRWHASNIHLLPDHGSDQSTAWKRLYLRVSPVKYTL